MQEILDRISEIYGALIVETDNVKAKGKSFDMAKKQLEVQKEKLDARENDVNARARIVGNLESVSDIKKVVDAKNITNAEQMRKIVEAQKVLDASIKESKALEASIKVDTDIVAGKIRSLKERELALDKKAKGLKEGLLGKLAKELEV